MAVCFVLMTALAQSGISSVLLLAVYSIARFSGRVPRLLWALIVSVLGAHIWFVLTVRMLEIVVWLGLKYAFYDYANNAIQFFYSDYSHAGVVFCLLLAFFSILSVKKRAVE